MAMYLLARKGRKDKRKKPGKISSQQFTGQFCLPFCLGRGNGSKIQHEPAGGSSSHVRPTRCFSLSALKRATKQFHESNILDDENENFTVYRGQLANKEYVRVRRTRLRNTVTLEQFQSELEVLSSVHHRNLVSLVGFCSDGGENLLVYEDVEGTLSDHLFNHHGHPLSWGQRMTIALGVASGLTHLHEHADPPIVHRNIKSSSILLNHKLVPKVSEVGLSKQMTEETEPTRPTVGYLPPEHYESGTCSNKSDVYAYGVVLLELLTGMKSFDRERHQHHGKVLLVDLMRSAYAKGWRSVSKRIDPHIRNEAHDKAQKRLLNIAMACVEANRNERPTMREIEHRLEELQRRPPSTYSLTEEGFLDPETTRSSP